MIGAGVEGLDEVRAGLKRFRETMHGATVEGIKDATKIVAADARRNAPSASTHRIKRNYWGRQVSSEVTPLGRNITSRIIDKWQQGQVWGLVKARWGYALFLEYGTRTMRSRPFIRKALGNVIDKVADRIAALAGRGQK